MTGQLQNKVAVITGAASGIGLAAVARFIEEGARVVIADVQDELGEQAAQRFGDQAVFHHTDVSVEADVEGAVAKAVDAFGRLDVMYNNAGTGGAGDQLAELEADDFDRTLAINVRGVFLGHRYAVRQFRAQGGGGAIVTTASAASLEAGWGPSGYVVSKHAVLGIVRQAVADFAGEGIRSNAVAPGIIMTPLFARTFGVAVEHAEEFISHLTDALAHTQPIGRVGLPVDIANAAVFLASDAASFITGACLSVDGGATALNLSSFGADVVQAVADFNATR